MKTVEEIMAKIELNESIIRRLKKKGDYYKASQIIWENNTLLWVLGNG